MPGRTAAYCPDALLGFGPFQLAYWTREHERQRIRNDTHFWLTYYLAVRAGYTSRQATQIASADISVDLDKDTEPVFGNLVRGVASAHPLTNAQKVRGKFHALPRRKDLVRQNGYPQTHWWDPVRLDRAGDALYRARYAEMLVKANQVVSQRLSQFWKETLDNAENPGVFLHYLQDSFAHRGFISYIGHVGYDYVDLVATDPAKAREMARATLQYLKAFKQFQAKEIDLNSALQPTVFIVLSANETTEIDNVIDRMASANPSEGVSENRVFHAWLDSSEDQRRKRHRAIPPKMLFAFTSMIGKNPAPASSKVKQVVLAFLPEVSEEPLIWQYDLKANGMPSRGYTKEAYGYRHAHPAPANRITFDSSDENNNWKLVKDAPDRNGRVPCLYFKIEDLATPKTCR